MGYDAPLLEPRQQRRHRRGRQIALPPQRIRHFPSARLAALPQHAQNVDLQVGQFMGHWVPGTWALGNYECNTTSVVYSAQALPFPSSADTFRTMTTPPAQRLRIALGQYDIGWHDAAESLARAGRVIARAAKEGADLVVLPETRSEE